MRSVEETVAEIFAKDDQKEEKKGYSLRKGDLFSYGTDIYNFLEDSGFKAESMKVYSFCDFVNFAIEHPKQLDLSEYSKHTSADCFSDIFGVADKINTAMKEKIESELKKVSKDLDLNKGDKKKRPEEEIKALEEKKKELQEDLRMLSSKSTGAGKTYITVNWVMKHILTEDMYKKSRMPYA